MIFSLFCALTICWSVETSTTLDKQLNMLFQVHSPIVLSPPKADLEGKKMRYNPEIIHIQYE